MSELPVPPRNHAAECAVLGGILRDPESLHDVLAAVRPEAFYLDAHRRILTAIVGLVDRGIPVDLVTLFEELKRRGHVEDVGGSAYLVGLWETTPTAANVVYHAKLVHEAFQLRGLIHAANEILRDAYNPTGPAAELLATAEQKLFVLNADVTADAEPRSVGAVAQECLDAIDERIASGSSLAGLSVGYPDLDHVTGGLRGGDLLVLGARPSLGKTALSLNIAERVAAAGNPVLFFSLEMRAREITDRLLSMRSGVPMSKMARAKDLGKGDLDALFRAGTGSNSALGALPLYIEDTPNVTAARISTVARRACRKYGIGLIVVDYLGLIRPEDARANRSQQIGDIALRMKNLARSLDVPVILLSQLNRDLEHAKRRPQLSDLRESGDIEAHADLVFLLHREPDLPASDPVWPVDVVVAKQRNGPTGDVRLSYRRPVLRFENAGF
ncbi:replicative dna helicase : Replicative DNA helicase OS=Singulisphaera acidiphila (strain ATCC BAA-1392 / DSM 18658 / VKM B-2454 / MOB10) GN=Sinac_0836 PE=4 SV=1: DnaB: DnaB_C [Gemmata massiliana]|uniref:Replicative DNA helicase n=1 Tax=Gemmata massiliana TaxID=1210884 RepID=A0A6P2CT96_9BACT|nr:replicative DNA helicase [Gemmata massiliana]VTR92161.1 replicative dna helicase : Replicative DNA helicase OS=Singulisphaera acidiphila (strain ATCC BAA-1392 / DSM 18658 / VKM B-2454 / MOB10) GN=Sinac_0836 PE=4 SV=1: DnaB: DnaB_C [Gemmata massiliana]